MSIWDPVSVSGPSESDIQSNELMRQWIDSVAPLAVSSEVSKRQRIIESLQSLVSQWVGENSAAQGLAGDHFGKVFTFGSFRLGLISPDSDIDALAVGPRHVTREGFFDEFPRKLVTLPGIESIQPVPDAVAPLIKLKIEGVEVDLLFAKINVASIDPLTLTALDDDSYLKNLDEKSVRCVNGTRVADSILRLIPDRTSFRLALRVIKYFAKKRGLYANVVGFFGGITWALLVARVCQMYPKFCAFQLVQKFFLVFARWNWKNPVLLYPVEYREVVGLMSLKVWNPRQYAADRSHLMPIITPAFPCMNSTYNVTESTRNILLSEIARAHKLFSNKSFEKSFWDELCMDPKFFHSLPLYLQLSVSGPDQEAVARFAGFVESRIRLLIKTLQHTAGVGAVRPWPQGVIGSLGASSWFIGLSVDPSHNTIDLRPPVSTFLEKTHEFFLEGKEREGSADLRISYLQQKNLPQVVSGKKPEISTHSGGIYAEVSAWDEVVETKEENDVKRRRVEVELGVE